MASSRLFKVLLTMLLGLLFGVVTVLANRLTYPGGAVVSLIIGTNFGWMLWPFLIGFFSRLNTKLSMLAGALSTMSAVVSYYLVDDLVVQSNPDFNSTVNATVIWGGIAMVIGAFFGALGGESSGSSIRSIICLIFGSGAIAFERITGYIRQSNYPHPPAALADATVLSLIVLGFVTIGIFVAQFTKIRRAES